MRRGSASIVANPVLVGAVTALVVVVAVFLAYNANKGLPFVPTTNVKFLVSNGANLIEGNEVREGGGPRIGIITEMRPVRLPDGTVGAEATMKIDAEAADLPKDSTINLRPRSVLGLKYVELTRGRSKETFQDGETMPQENVRYPVELDDFHRIFDDRTRRAVQTNLEGFGNALTSRGVALNTTIQTLPRFLIHLTPVAETLADDRNQLARFFKELGDAARVISPIADRYAHQFEAGADTFEAWSRFPDRLRQTIRDNAPTMRVGIRSFRVQRPFLRDTAAFSRSLRRATAVMPGALPPITGALRTGIPVLEKQPGYNEELGRTLTALEELMGDDRTMYALRSVTRLVDVVHPLIRFVGPYITVCNYFNYSWSNVGEHLTEPDPTGGSQRTLLNQFPRTVDPRAPSMGSIGARQPSNGEETLPGNPRMNLHTNVYTAAIDHQGNADCESGQRGYLEKLTTYNSDPNLKIVTDPHIPGNSGPTLTGRPRVPGGQTFTRLPESGPRMPRELDK
jgi:ABC-type transporter Mla subunit MlaD